MNNFKSVKSSVIGASVNKNLGTDERHLNLESPGEQLLIPTRTIAHTMMCEETSIDQAISILSQNNHEKHLFIGDGTNLQGVINLRTLVSRKVLVTANKKGVSRLELTVSDVMENVENMVAISAAGLAHCCIGDLKVTLEEAGRWYLLVVDEHKVIVGVISLEDINNLLGEQVNPGSTVQSFSEICDVIHNHAEIA